MTATTNENHESPKPGTSPIEMRAQEIFSSRLTSDQGRTDRLFAILMPLEWLGAVLMAIFISPLAWSGNVSEPHVHLVAALVLGFLVVAVPLYLVFKHPGNTLTRHVVAAAQVIMSILLIHITGGRIETHFHVFGSLAFLSFYRDWRVLITASAIVAADHILRGLFWPQSVYGVVAIEPWRWLEHAAWVVFEDLFLIIAIRQSLQDMHQSAEQQAELETINKVIADKIESQSEQLHINELALSEKSAALDETLGKLVATKNLALEGSRLKSEFLANMSHEIRTPMNAIIGMTDLLLRSTSDKKSLQLLMVIREAGQGLLTIIGDILDYSKIEAGKLMIELTEISIVDCVEGTAELLGPSARQKGIALLVFVDPAIPETVIGDAGRLRQILINLVGNAIKFTTIGHVVLRATLEDESPGSVNVLFSIQDTGIGMPDETLSHLFEPFTQADGSTTRKFGGTGLGLAICKRLATLMGGDIAITSSEGKGSTFSFTLPFEYPHETLAALESDDDQWPELVGKRILIADDDHAACEILHRYCQAWHLDYEVVYGSPQALAALQTAAAQDKPFDIAIVDLLMPGMDAMELTAQIAQMPELRATKFILITAFDKEGQGVKALESGFGAYLRKPIKRSDLLQALLTVSGHKRPDSGQHALRYEHLEESNQAEAEQTGGLILVADDHPANLMVAQMQLSELGYSCHTAANGLEAVAATQSTHYDLILMDAMMPQMDGYDATAAIRQQEIATGTRIPIVAMTAKAMSGDREKCLAAGMDDYLAKPIELAQLRSVIAKWVPDRKRQINTPTTRGTKAVDLTEFSTMSKLFGPPGLMRLWQVYETQTKDELEAMVRCIKGKDAEALFELAHKLKGGSASCRINSMQELSAKLESIARSGDWPQIRKTFNELYSCFKYTRSAARDLLQSSGLNK